ncbi:MAG: TMEM175 family protein [Actinomycetota bacterium]
MEKGRLETFSDGVIAITLLVLDIRVPDREGRPLPRSLPRGQCPATPPTWCPS